MNTVKYVNLAFNIMLVFSLVFVAYVIIDAESINLIIGQKSNWVVVWLFSLICVFWLKELLDYWIVDRSGKNLVKIILEFIGVIFFTYILVGSI